MWGNTEDTFQTAKFPRKFSAFSLVEGRASLLISMCGQVVGWAWRRGCGDMVAGGDGDRDSPHGHSVAMLWHPAHAGHCQTKGT